MRLPLATLILTGFGLIASPAVSACLDDGLFCQMPRGKFMEVCAGTEMFLYAYGDSDPAEIELGMEYSAANVTPWIGAGSSVWSSGSFVNNDYVYEVWISADRDREADSDTEAGVIVSRNGKELARLNCVPGTVEGDPEFFGAKMEENGWCHEPQSGAWLSGRACN